MTKQIVQMYLVGAIVMEKDAEELMIGSALTGNTSGERREGNERKTEPAGGK